MIVFLGVTGVIAYFVLQIIGHLVGVHSRQ